MKLRALAGAILVASVFCQGLAGQESGEQDPAILFRSGFVPGQWEFSDADAWKFDGKILELHRKQSNYNPEHRSPRHIALLKDQEFGSFQLDVKVLSTHEDYNHRDVCLFFGYQGPGRFYYVHLGKKMDPHANQVFIVNKAPRTSISKTTTDGTPWDEQWHDVRILRDIETGLIQVFYDNMDEPVMTAEDKTFGKGRIGLGSFDDTASFDELAIRKRDGKQ